MRKTFVQLVISSILILAVLAAGSPVIGTVVANGAFRLDNATVHGNATLFEGATIETAAAASTMELTSGAKVVLAPMSKGRFFGDHVVLERGLGQLEKAEGLKFQARGLTIQPETGNASARIVLVAVNRLDVSALSGSFRVLNSHGMLVANVANGRTLELEPQAPNTPSRITGCVLFKSGHYVMTDETTFVMVEVSGSGVNKEKGNRVEITGAVDPTATPVSDASQYIRVSSVKRLGKGCLVDIGSAGGATGAAGAAAPAPVSTAGGSGGIGGFSVGTIAIVGGVAAAAVVGGVVAARSTSGSSSTVSH